MDEAKVFLLRMAMACSLPSFRGISRQEEKEERTDKTPRASTVTNRRNSARQEAEKEEEKGGRHDQRAADQREGKNKSAVLAVFSAAAFDLVF